MQALLPRTLRTSYLALGQIQHFQISECTSCSASQHAHQLLKSKSKFSACFQRHTCTTFAPPNAGSPLKRQKVAVAVSGGVDSAVAAHMMKKQGHEVFGIFMRNWDEAEEKGNQNCSAEADFQDAQRVCKQVGIPLYEVDFISEYWNKVFVPFLDMVGRGLTPNPDLQCNRHIKFQALLDHARILGAERIATGHYARLRHSPDGSSELLRAADSSKDQTYFLASVPGTAFQDVVFPVGNLQKGEVREIAAANGLHVATRRSSTGICFIGRRNFQQFLEEYSTAMPATFVDVDSGREVGQCANLLTVTLGQKAGLGGQKERLYVVGKDIPGRVAYVASGSSHPALLTHFALLGIPHWISGSPPEALSAQQGFQCRFVARYRQPLQSCILKPAVGLGDIALSKLVKLAPEDQPDKASSTMMVQMQAAARSITPQQSFVLYREDVCLGCAPILCPGQTVWETENERQQVTYVG